VDTHYFKGKDGKITSMRVSGNNLRINQYVNGKKGGVTFTSPSMSTRLNHKGQYMGSGIKSGKTTTYFGKNGGVQKYLTPY
jgi:hypothetical protein